MLNKNLFLFLFIFILNIYNKKIYLAKEKVNILKSQLNKIIRNTYNCMINLKTKIYVMFWYLLQSY
jgi:hypothetical protein